MFWIRLISWSNCGSLSPHKSVLISDMNHTCLGNWFCKYQNSNIWHLWHKSQLIPFHVSVVNWGYLEPILEQPTRRHIFANTVRPHWTQDQTPCHHSAVVLDYTNFFDQLTDQLTDMYRWIPQTLFSNWTILYTVQWGPQRRFSGQGIQMGCRTLEQPQTFQHCRRRPRFINH